MGLSGSWMLFTGLLGAWLSAFSYSKSESSGHKYKLLFHKFWSLLQFSCGFIGWNYFCWMRRLYKLASFGWSQISIRMWFKPTNSVNGYGNYRCSLHRNRWPKAVIYTDTIQWLIFGLVFIGIPIAYHAVGGYDIKATLDPNIYLN
jgi:SSS family solute:Na+ symporter